MKGRSAFGLSVGLHVAVLALVAGLGPSSDGSASAQPIEIQTLRPLETVNRTLDQKIAAKPAKTAAPPTINAPALPDRASPPTPTAEPTAALEGGEGTVTSETTARLSAQSRYELYVRSQIARKKTYPPTARRLGHTGRVILKFRVLASGEVQAAELAQKSAHDSLNQDALKILRGLARLEPIPSELGRAEWLFVVPVDYDLN